MASFELPVSQRQLAVFATELESPFSAWNGRHVAQGFIWRPQTVAFRTLDDGPIAVTATRTRSESALAPSRIIRVPFEVPKNGQLRVASGANFKELHLPGGHYDLTFEHGLDLEGQWCNLLFTACGTPSEPAVLLADAEIHPASPLLMKASALEEP